MAIFENANNGVASVRFDPETVLEVGQRGGGGSGVGGDDGLYAKNVITGEDTNTAIQALAEQVDQLEDDLETANGTIATQAATIAAQQATIDAFPTIEALNVTANGTYDATGKAYKPVTVNVSGIVQRVPPNKKITIQSGYTGKIVIYHTIDTSNIALSVINFANNNYTTLSQWAVYRDQASPSVYTVCIIDWGTFDPGTITSNNSNISCVNGIYSNIGHYVTFVRFTGSNIEDFNGGFTLTATN